MVTFDEKIKRERAKVASDKVRALLPLDTEEDIRRALRVVLDELSAINNRLLILEAKNN